MHPPFHSMSLATSWLSRLGDTKCCHNDWVTPPFARPAVGSYIIARPCCAWCLALCACQWAWLCVRLNSGWEDTTKRGSTCLHAVKTRPQSWNNRTLFSSSHSLCFWFLNCIFTDADEQLVFASIDLYKCGRWQHFYVMYLILQYRPTVCKWYKF